MFDRNKKPHNPNITRDSLVQIRPVRHLLKTHHAAAALPGVARASWLWTSVAAGASAAAVLLAFFLGWQIRLSVVKTGSASIRSNQEYVCAWKWVGGVRYDAVGGEVEREGKEVALGLCGVLREQWCKVVCRGRDPKPALPPHLSFYLKLLFLHLLT